MTEGNEHISALMDDDYDQHSLNELLQNDDLKQTWTRYHLIGDCLREHLPDQIDTNLAQRVSAQLADEPTVLAPVAKQNHTLKPVMGFAIAASVALVAVLGIRQNTDSVSPVPAQAVVASTEIAQPEITPDTFTFNEPQVRPASIQSDTPAAMPSQRMSGYLVNHNQFRSSNSMHGGLPYVRIITIESQE